MNNITDRGNLEWLVFWALANEFITMSRGRELLRFEHMNEMRDWYNKYFSEASRMDGL